MGECLNDIDWKKREMEIVTGKVALYGAGKYGKIALDNIRKYLPQLNVEYFLDDDRIRNNESIEGIKIISLEEAMRKKKDFYILITNYYVLPVLKRIEMCQFDINKVFFWNELLIEDIDKHFLKLSGNKLEQVFDNLNDYQSKMIFRTIVEARYMKKFDILSRLCQDEQYFPMDIFNLSDNEVVVDGGAFDGDTIRQFLKHTKAKFKYVYAFEPDKINYEKLKKNKYSKNILLYNAGLWDETVQVNFLANKGGSSKIEEKGLNVIQAYKFDELELPNKEITFVKMDIEGSELRALMGMKETIKRCKPKLAICIYHKFEDLWELPLYIKKLVPEYKLYIRNYTTYLDEIVLYATL